MTHIIAKMKAITLLVLVSISGILSSFSEKKGGEGFEIYLNNNLLLQQFGSQMNNVKNILLDNRFSNDQLVIKYYHCGQTGKNRSITVMDGQNKILKEWRFANITAANLTISDAAMTCTVKDILSLQKSSPGKLSLYYSSSELPKGRILANIISGEVGKAK